MKQRNENLMDNPHEENSVITNKKLTPIYFLEKAKLIFVEIWGDFVKKQIWGVSRFLRMHGHILTTGFEIV